MKRHQLIIAILITIAGIKLLVIAKEDKKVEQKPVVKSGVVLNVK